MGRHHCTVLQFPVWAASNWQGCHPTARSLCLAGSRLCHCHHLFSEEGKRPMETYETREMGEGRMLLIKKSDRKAWEDLRRKEKRKLTKRVLTCLHFISCFIQVYLVLSSFIQGAVLPFPPLLPHVPSCCHPGLPSHPACGPAVLFLSHDEGLSEPRKAHFLHLDGIRQNLAGVKLVSTPTVYVSSDHHTYGLRVFVRKVTMWLESMSVNVS